jgi:hypothetical protein
MVHTPTKRAKGRFPDVEDGLLTWVKSQQELGINPSDCEIRDKAVALRTMLGCSEEHDEKIRSLTWMERIRVKIALQ